MGIDFVKDHIGFSTGKQCKSSPDGYHHCDSSGFGAGKLGTDDEGRYSILVCTHCGEEFKYYNSFGSAHGSGFSDLQQSYSTQVQALPAQGFTSEGNLIWSPALSDFSKITVFAGWSSYGVFYPPSDAVTYEDPYYSGVFYEKLSEHSARVYGSRSSGASFGAIGFEHCQFPLPFDCSYKRISSPYLDLSYRDTNGILKSASSFYGGSSTYNHGTFGGNLSLNSKTYLKDLVGAQADVLYFSYTVYTPQYLLIPDTSLTDDTYNINSRPTSITGDYGIIGDNGQIIKVEGNTIVNETDNTVYNPVTNTTSNVTDWQYDYSTRTYNLTLDNGTTSTVTYGDENVTIVEGDTTYNVYYLVEDTSTDTPAPCNHSWTETSATPATCTVPGSRLLTCSLCNETKTEAIPAPGHSWVIRQTVNTEYDDTGNKTQEGYTIFECSVCGEQYKSTDGAAPPGSGSSPGPGGSGGVFSGIFGLLVDFLGFFWNTFHDFVGEGVKGFLTALMDGTSSIFGLLNPFDWGG